MKAALFKFLNTGKCSRMVRFELNKQTQKSYVTEWLKRNAVIKQGALPLFTKLVAASTRQSDLFLPLWARNITVMPLWTVKDVFVNSTFTTFQ